MELLIPGLILVALMVYASTKIKKIAARAYEEEIIETDKFSILKPEGFINPFNDDQYFAFLAYSRDFGKDRAGNLRQATAEVSVYKNANFEEVCERTRASANKIVSTEEKKLNENKICEIEAERGENGIAIDTFYKITERGGSIYELRISVLPEHREEFLRRIEMMIESFNLN